MNVKYYLLLLVFINLSSCKSKKEASNSAHEAINVKAQSIPTINQDSLVQIRIQYLVNHLDSSSFKLDSHFVFSSTVLPRAYKDRDYYPLWKSSKNRNDAISTLKKSWQHGLLPDDYDLTFITQLENTYDSLSIEEKAHLDIHLTDAVILYAYHMIKGKLNPETLSSTWNFDERALPEDTAQLLLTSLKNETLLDGFNQLEPIHDSYDILKSELIRYRQLVVEGGWETISFDKSIHPNESHQSIPSLRQRLHIEGYLSKQDTGLVYDPKVVEAVKDFQIHHGLHPDGIIGQTTLKLINLSAEHKLKTLITNIERLKWIKLDKLRPYIKVNIASFQMQYFNHGQETYSSNVVVGKTQKKTPVFQDLLELVVLNPTWTLPFSITSTETLRKLKHDSSYLRKHNMVLLTSKGKVVSDEGIDWNKYSEGHFPYMVRQQPGPDNALGQVKFLFPNKYAIYLHDTPSKHLFSKDERAFSHGCIRLQNPLNFAQFLLSKQDTSWTMNRIHDVIKTHETETIRLHKKIPIYLIYLTANIGTDGRLYFYQDVYNRDEDVYQKLMNRETQLEIEKSRIGE